MWDFKRPSPTWAGVLSTAGGLVFSGSNEGNFYALDAKTGKPLWQFQTGGPIRSGPMSFGVGGKQHVAIAGGRAIFVFALDAGEPRNHENTKKKAVRFVLACFRGPRSRWSREIAGPRLHGRPSIPDPHVQTVPPVFRYALRRIADEISVAELLEDLQKCSSEIARRID